MLVPFYWMLSNSLKTEAEAQKKPPTMLPMAIPLAPDRAALMATTSSGAEVPNATTVRPIRMEGMPNLSARATAPLTNKSPQKSRITKPLMIDRYIIGASSPQLYENRSDCIYVC